MENLISLWATSGLAQIQLGQVAMMAVGLLSTYPRSQPSQQSSRTTTMSPCVAMVDETRVVAWALQQNNGADEAQ